MNFSVVNIMDILLSNSPKNNKYIHGEYITYCCYISLNGLSNNTINIILDCIFKEFDQTIIWSKQRRYLYAKSSRILKLALKTVPEEYRDLFTIIVI
jgi:hypothetical protein